MKIQKSQQKIIIAVAIVVIAILGFTQFVYLPKRKLMNELKTQLVALRNKISQEKITFEQPQQLAEAILIQKKQLQNLLYKLPKKQALPSVIKELSNTALQSGINIISVKPLDSRPYLDTSGQPILMNGLSCEKLPLEIELKGNFIKVGKYLENLFDNLSAQISIEDLKIHRDEGIQPDLKASVVVAIYVLSAEGK